MLAVLQHNLADITDTFPVDKNPAMFHLVDYTGFAGRKGDNIAVCHDDAALSRNADLFRQAGMFHQVAVFAMDRQEPGGRTRFRISFSSSWLA